MENLAPPEPQASFRLTQDQAQELVLRTVATQAESLLRTAYRHSLCDDDAHDAYQRSMEIFLRRARTLDPVSAHKWLHVVIKREAMEVRRGRSDSVASEDINFDHHPSFDVSTPEERALTVDRTTRAAEALRRLKPQELRAMWLKALGHSYAEIAQATGFSATKVNRCLAEGRKSFLERFEGIETGAECERWQPVLSAMVDGEATAAQVTEARPHLRNCPACRATLRGLHEAHTPLVAVLPVGLMSVGAKLTGLVERLLPGASGGTGPVDAGAAVGGAGFLGAGGLKLAGLLAAGAAATAGGGLVVEHETSQHRAAVAAEAKGSSHRSGAVTTSATASAHRVTTTAAVATTTSSPGTPKSVASGSGSSTHANRAARARALRLAARRHAQTGRIEFAPRGIEPEVAAPVASRASAPHATPAPASPTPTPTSPTVAPSPSSSSAATPSEPNADSSAGEFAPQP
jgi:RNA polymerase sigma factor (sigma-70 family)